jgi:hypothetical protein
VRLFRALERRSPDDERGSGEQQTRRCARFVPGQETTSMVEMEVAQHDDVYARIVESKRRERTEQDVIGFDDAVAISEPWFEECSNSGLEEHTSSTVLDEHGTTRQFDPSLVVGSAPARPKGARHVSEHRPAVESL